MRFLNRSVQFFIDEHNKSDNPALNCHGEWTLFIKLGSRQILESVFAAKITQSDVFEKVSDQSTRKVTVDNGDAQITQNIKADGSADVGIVVGEADALEQMIGVLVEEMDHVVGVHDSDHLKALLNELFYLTYGYGEIGHSGVLLSAIRDGADAE